MDFSEEERAGRREDAHESRRAARVGDLEGLGEAGSGCVVRKNQFVRAQDERAVRVCLLARGGASELAQLARESSLGLREF